MEVIEGTAVEIPASDVETVNTKGWQGDFPFFLVIEPDDKANGNVGIDLDETGWIATNAALMRAPGTWLLYHKGSQRPVFCIVVEEGDQPFFRKHHVGNLMVGSEVMSVGMGKKKANGERVELWLLPNGVVCGSEEDVDTVSGKMLGG